MEICLRAIRMRKKNFISVMQLLNMELGKGYLQMSTEERWGFFARVIKNPATATQVLPMPDSEKQEFEKYLAGAKKWKVLAGVFETVSLEYLLRCLAECNIVKNAVDQNS